MPKRIIRDENLDGWYIEITWQRGGGVVQVATVNEHSEAHLADARDRFTGWRAVLSPQGQEELILALVEASVDCRMGLASPVFKMAAAVSGEVR